MFSKGLEQRESMALHTWLVQCDSESVCDEWACKCSNALLRHFLCSHSNRLAKGKDLMLFSWATADMIIKKCCRKSWQITHQMCHGEHLSADILVEFPLCSVWLLMCFKTSMFLMFWTERVCNKYLTRTGISLRLGWQQKCVLFCPGREFLPVLYNTECCF